MVLSIKLPKLKHRDSKKNSLGYTLQDYLGSPTTLCGGCGHDAVSKAISLACFESSIHPHELVKLSGIGCSSKTPAYFVSGAHSFNAVHGRMPTIATGAAVAHRNLKYIAISGDGDSASIGLGSFVHCMKRHINLTYICENNGVFGLTKGQFSATADQGTTNKRGLPYEEESIDLVNLALNMGAGWVARGFSANKSQLVPLIQDALAFPGFAFLDVVSPCVSFNNHDGSTKSYAHFRQQEQVVVTPHTDKWQALKALHKHQTEDKVPTGLIYKSEQPVEWHLVNQTSKTPLRDLSPDEVRPSSAILSSILRSIR